MLTRCNRLDRFGGPGWRSSFAAVLLALTLSSGIQAQESGDLDEFFRSVTDGRVEIVEEGLRRHPEWANAELFLGIRPVYRAAVLGREEVLALLLQAGADVNAVTDRGTHPLHASAEHGNTKITDRLLDAGANVNVANEAGQTPLFFAVRFAHPELAELLLARGASTEVTDRWGRTPLHYAAALGYLDCSRLLAENGAFLDAVDGDGFSPLGLCRTWKRNDFVAVAQYLVSKGAQDLRPEQAWQEEAAGSEGTAK